MIRFRKHTYSLASRRAKTDQSFSPKADCKHKNVSYNIIRVDLAFCARNTFCRFVETKRKRRNVEFTIYQ